MIYGNNILGIKNIEKLYTVCSDFTWNNVVAIEKVNYYMEYNEYYDMVSNLILLFIIELPDKKYKLLVKFCVINNLNMNNFGGCYNQIMGLEVINQRNCGWENEYTYIVRDYENGSIEFYCESIEILEIIPI